MLNFFKKKPDPVIGEYYLFKRTAKEDPWVQETYSPVLILDVKEGWVRYSLGNFYKDNRLTIKEFHKLYERKD